MEERNNLLSRENELLTINYQKITKDFFDFKMGFNDKYQDFTVKINLFEKLRYDFQEQGNILTQTKNKLVITENKLFETLDEVGKFELMRENFLIEKQRMNDEILRLNEGNNFYKAQLNINKEFMNDNKL